MVLRNLAQGRVGLGDQGDDLRQGDVGHACTAVCLRHADAPQAGAGKHVQLGQRQAAFAVALGAVAAEVFGQVAGDNKGLFIAGDNRDVMRKGHAYFSRGLVG